jgi:hypothetical protein
MTDVRIPNPKTDAFIKNVPTVPKIVLEHCEYFLRELESRSISEENEIIGLLEWWIYYRSVGDNTN